MKLLENSGKTLAYRNATNEEMNINSPTQPNSESSRSYPHSHPPPPHIQWNLRIKNTLEQGVLSFIERFPLFGG